MVRKPKIVNKSVIIAATATGASATVLYTCPTRFISEVKLLTVSNPTAGPVNVTIEIYNVKDTTYYTFIDTFSVAGNSVLYAVGEGDTLYLDEGDRIVVSESVGSSMKSFVSLIESYSEVTR